MPPANFGGLPFENLGGWPSKSGGEGSQSLGAMGVGVNRSWGGTAHGDWQWGVSCRMSGGGGNWIMGIGSGECPAGCLVMGISSGEWGVPSDGGE